MRRITLVQGHPDPAGNRLLHSLADAYALGAKAGGNETRRIEVAALEFPLLRSSADFEQGQGPESLGDARDAIRWAEHLVFFYPLWLGDMPALLKGFLEQTMRPGFAFAEVDGLATKPGLGGRSARIVVTMGMPAIAYRLWYRAHSLKSFERNILNFVGIKPVRSTLFGMVEGVSDDQRQGWLEQMHGLGRRGG